MTGMPAFMARATAGVSGAASKGEIISRSTPWVMKLSTCEVCVLSLPAPSAICNSNCGISLASLTGETRGGDEQRRGGQQRGATRVSLGCRGHDGFAPLLVAGALQGI